jgi:hypothetical protein
MEELLRVENLLEAAGRVCGKNVVDVVQTSR